MLEWASGWKRVPVNGQSGCSNATIFSLKGWFAIIVVPRSRGDNRFGRKFKQNWTFAFDVLWSTPCTCLILQRKSGSFFNVPPKILFMSWAPKQMPKTGAIDCSCIWFFSFESWHVLSTMRLPMLYLSSDLFKSGMSLRLPLRIMKSAYISCFLKSFRVDTRIRLSYGLRSWTYVTNFFKNRAFLLLKSLCVLSTITIFLFELPTNFMPTNFSSSLVRMYCVSIKYHYHSF